MCLTTKYLSNNISNITKDIRSNYTYVEDPPWRNKSNRLKKIEKYNSKYFDLTGDYSFDPDGNFTSLTRSYNSDNFSYGYYSGTNRLKKVTGLTDQYTYDYNGNQTNDYVNNNTGIKYDHRNLITEFTRQDLTQDPPVTDITRYKYDEAGNRTRKTIYRSNDSNPPPLPEENEDLPSGWSITKDEYYSRDASGKEIAVYQSYNLDYWNVWGTGNEGRIKSTGMKYFFLKDHLGSIRAVINQNNVIVQAQDYDPWGHIARTWDSTSADYKFTGKEHDKESTYDYFGARYYDSRVGNWKTTDSLLNKYLQISPYNYSYRNPMIFIDPNGKNPRRSQLVSKNVLINILNETSTYSYSELSNYFDKSNYKYIYTTNGGFLDLKHFFAAADYSSKFGEDFTLLLGEEKEKQQQLFGSSSAWNPEDLPSNKAGAFFGSKVSSNRFNLDLDKFVKFITDLGILDPDNEKISREKIYIPENETDNTELPPNKTYNPYHGEKPGYKNNLNNENNSY